MTDIALEMVWNEKCKEQIKKHEGYRGEIYLDSVGVPTGGYGHAFHLNSTLPRNIWEDIFSYDFSIHKDSFMVLSSQRGYQDLSPARKSVLLNMIFNLGINGVLKFQRTLAALDRREYELVAKYMLESKWATQVGQRAIDLARQMETGQWM